jgi:hypothetical protein
VTRFWMLMNFMCAAPESSFLAAHNEVMTNDRVNAGVPTGGQFAAQNRADTAVELDASHPKNEDDFDAEFTTVDSPKGETFWNESELVVVDSRKVWTYTETDGNFYYCAGQRFVNRAEGADSYIVTEEPWTDENAEYKLTVNDDQDREGEL